MSAAFHVEVVSPERIVFSGEAEAVVCRTVGEGEVAFLAGHAPFLGALEDGSTVRVMTVGGGEESTEVSGGFVHVRDNSVIVLA